MAPFLSLAALATGAFAAVLQTRQDGLGLRTDTYEELTTNPLAPQLSAVGTYNGLEYDGFVVGQPGLPILNNICLGNLFCLGTVFNGLRPQSGVKVAATGIIETLTQIGGISLYPSGTITAGDNINSFNLQSFFFGCLANTANSVIVPPSGCTITVTGFYTNGAQAPTVSYTFRPTSLSRAPLARAVLPLSYSAPVFGLRNVSIGIAAADFTPTLSVLILDDLVHLNRLV